MSRSTLGVAVVVVAAFAAACSGGDGGSARPADTTAAPTAPTTAAPSTTAPAPSTTARTPELTAVTFNAGLAQGFVPLAAERVPLVAEALADLDADVVALQEVWAPEDVQAIADAVQARYPNQCFLDPQPETAGEPACPPPELDALSGCAQTWCADATPDQLAACVLEHCGAEFAGLSGKCQTCLGANIGSDLDTGEAACTKSSELYAYGGSFGIGLLSRYPIETWDETVLDSSLNRRAVIHAVLDTGDAVPLHVFATHLSAVFSDIPYPGVGTWAGEQRDQIERLLALIAERVPAGEPVLVLGDLNTGPELPGIVGEVPENFSLLTATDLVAPYVEALPEPGCTFCADNPLVGGADDDESVVIDHVLVRGLQASAARRIFDQPVPVAGTDARLSDHYGVLVTLVPAG
jgi:endonuclease/exonuclease/phosphatase family metal-dependent hydrolase